MKYAVSFVAILVGVIGTMLFVQYKVYSDQLEESGQAFGYSQEIEVEYRDGSLVMIHHFKNLPNEEVSIKWPSIATNTACFLEAEYSCERFNNQMFSAGETRTQSVSYIIPLKGGLQSGRLMQDVFAKLPAGEAKFTTIHIATENEIKGQWVTGLPLIGQQSLKLVNYSMFSGTGDVSELYWQKKRLTASRDHELMSVYSQQPIPAEFTKQLQQMTLLDQRHISIVQGPKSNLNGERIVFLPELTIEQLQQKVLLAQVQTRYQFEDTPQWLMELVTSYVTGTTIGQEKTLAIMETLNQQMSAEQLINWQDRLQALQGKKITPTILDAELSAVVGGYTQYITTNSKQKGHYPFLYSEQRPVYLNDTQLINQQVILKDGVVLYAAEPLLKELGYEAKVGENGYYVKNATRAFRFPNEPGFYIFNQRRYNTISEPFVKVAGAYYIEETWLQRLFVVELKKTKDRLTITTTLK